MFTRERKSGKRKGGAEDVSQIGVEYQRLDWEGKVEDGAHEGAEGQRRFSEAKDLCFQLIVPLKSLRLEGIASGFDQLAKKTRVVEKVKRCKPGTGHKGSAWGGI